METRVRDTSWRFLQPHLYIWSHPDRWPLLIVYPVAAVFGAVIGWLLLEPFFQEGGASGQVSLANTFMSSVALGTAAGMINAVSFFVRGRFATAFAATVSGFGVAFVVCFVLLIPSQSVFATLVLRSNMLERLPLKEVFPVLIAGRSLSWSLLGLAVGTGAGFFLRSRSIALVGITGGFLGGLAAGLMFDPTMILLAKAGLDITWPSRLLGFITVAGTTGVFIAMAQGSGRQARLFITSGSDAGTRFTLDASPCYLVSQASDLLVSTDGDAKRAHAVVMRVGFTFVIEDMDDLQPVRVNGRTLNRCELHNGDVIRIGGNQILFSKCDGSGDH